MPHPPTALFLGMLVAQGRCNPAGQPCETWDPTTFKNLYTAVNAGNFGENRPFTVDRCEFLNNHLGVQSWAVDYLSVTRSLFEGGGSSVVTLPYIPGDIGPRAITVYGGTEYTVEENTLIGETSEFPLLIGIAVIETGEDLNSIYKNTLSNLTHGNLSLGENKGEFPFQGLEYECNKNEGNTYDFLAADESIYYPQVGIRPNQGSAQESAGNKFSPSPSLPESHFSNPEQPEVTYYYKGGVQYDEPLNISAGVVKLPSANSNNCDSKLVEEPPTPKIIRFNERSSLLDSLENELKLKIDDGDTESLLQTIGFSSSTDSQSVKAQLLQISPYVSLSALREYLEREDLFSENQLSEVLSANPEVLRIPAYWTMVEEILSSNAVSLLDSARQTRTQRNDEEAQISAVAGERAYLARQLTLHYLRDTSSYQADSIRYWIGQVNTLPHQYVLVSQYLQEGDTLQAANALDFIASNYALSASQQEAHEEFKELAEWKKAIMQSGDWIAYAEENQAELEDLAGEGISRSAIQAQHYYNFVFDQSWYPLIELPEGEGQSAGRIVSPSANPGPSDIEHSYPDIALEVIPNPARESVQLQYTFPSEEGKAVLRLFDPSGRLIQNWELKQGAGAIHWQVGPLMPKGIYLVTLELDRRKIVSRRFSIVE